MQFFSLDHIEFLNHFRLLCCMQLGVDSKTITDRLLHQRSMFGGNDSQPCADRQTRHHHRDRRIRRGQGEARQHPWTTSASAVGLWGIQLGTDHFFTELVPQHNAATLIAIIQHCIRPLQVTCRCTLLSTCDAVIMVGLATRLCCCPRCYW